MMSSHAPRERVSWNYHSRLIHPAFRCHAPRERVSWNLITGADKDSVDSHAPRERVSWNPYLTTAFEAVEVTLHVSVWVEILKVMGVKASHPYVTLHVSVWVEIQSMI